MAPATSTIADLAPAVGQRLQDPNYVFWQEKFEIYAGLAEAITELMLIIGRPTVIFNSPFSPTVNTVWQTIPTNLLAITNIVLPGGLPLRKTTLHALDYTQASWTSKWESDRAALPQRWAPLGLNKFVLHPAPLQPLTLNVTGIEYPILTNWPPSGSEPSPFTPEFDQALEMFAASYARVKEVGNDAAEGALLYQAFLEIGQRMSQIQDRRDSLVWTRGFGAATAPSQVSHR